MSNKNKFFTDAVAEAKTIKDTAFENAKIAMAESFAPTVKNMLSSQLNEMEEELEEEVSLEELLNSLDEGGEDDLPLEDELPSEDEFGSEDELEPEMGDDLGGEGLTGDEEVSTITVDDLKDIIRDVMQELEGPEEEFEAEETEMEEPEMDALEDDEEVNLDEIFGDSGLDEMSSTPQDGSNAAGEGLQNLIAQIKALVAKAPQAARQIQQALADAGASAGAAMRSEATELAESKKTITRLISEKRELNLLNSKLLHVNKLFKANSLTESQKVKVVNAIDRAKTTKESENIFLALKEAFINSNSTSKSLHENKGRASRPAGMSQRPNNAQILTEDVDFVNRMKKLAGII